MEKTASSEMKPGITRRGFVKSAALAASGTVAVGLVGCSKQAAAADYLPASWDYEADVVVVGFGGAGLAASITAKTENLGDVLVLEASPEAYSGGNSRVCGQLVLSPSDAAAAVKYQTALNGRYEVPKDAMQAWADELSKNVEWAKSLGLNLAPSGMYSPEFPEVEGSSAIKVYALDGKFGGGLMWKALSTKAKELGVKALYDTRATRFVANPSTKEVFGVVVEQGGAEKFIKARKSVILACGGFENNPDLLRTYASIGVSEYFIAGTPYNRGDGIKMVAALGADMWHLNNIIGAALAVPAGDKGRHIIAWASTLNIPNKAYIFVDTLGKRYMYEEKVSLQRHGKVNFGGDWVTNPTPTKSYVIMGAAAFGEADNVFKSMSGWTNAFKEEIFPSATNKDYLAKGTIVKGATVEDLAKTIEVDAKALAETVATYNKYVETGDDQDFSRGKAVAGENVGGVLNEGAIAAFPLKKIEGPFYAMKLVPAFLNTQGGPKRAADGGVLDLNGKAIPRLYTAGEFGCIYGYMYNAGGNFAESLSSGRTAIRSASKLDPWDIKK